MRTCLAMLALTALCLSGCGDPNAPPPTLRLVVATTGVVDEDPDGYVVIVDDQPRAKVAANDLRAFPLEPGTHAVRIEGLAPGCGLQGPANVSVTIEPGLPAEVTFRVECRATTGVIKVSAPASGRDFPAVFSVAVTDQLGTQTQVDVAPTILPAGGEATATVSMPPGQYEVRFLPTTTNCTLTGQDTRTVAVTAGGLTRDTARVEFAVACQATTGDVRLSVATTGSALDPDGYTVKLDGVLLHEQDDYYGGLTPVWLASNDSRLFERIVPGEHAFELGEVAANCAVGGPHPRTVSVSIGAVSELAISVVCSAP